MQDAGYRLPGAGRCVQLVGAPGWVAADIEPDSAFEEMDRDDDQEREQGAEDPAEQTLDASEHRSSDFRSAIWICFRSWYSILVFDSGISILRSRACAEAAP